MSEMVIQERLKDSNLHNYTVMEPDREDLEVEQSKCVKHNNLFLEQPKVPLINIKQVHKPASANVCSQEEEYDNILPQNESFDDTGAVPATKVPKLEIPGITKSGSYTSRNARSRIHRQSHSFTTDLDEFPNEIKNEAIVENLYGGKHNDEIDKILGDENMTQRRKEDMLFDMLDNLDLEDDFEDPEEEAKNPQKDISQDYVYHCEIKKEGHYPSLICGRVLSKILETRERCSTVVLKLIDVFLSKNSQVVMENLVYRFLNNRICKDYGLKKVKEMIRQSNPRQR